MSAIHSQREQRPQKRKGGFRRHWLTGFFLLFCALFGAAVVRSFHVEASAWEAVMAEQAALRQQLAAEQQRNQELHRQLEALYTPAAIEQAARSSLGYARPGEHVYQIPQNGR